MEFIVVDISIMNPHFQLFNPSKHDLVFQLMSNLNNTHPIMTTFEKQFVLNECMTNFCHALLLYYNTTFRAIIYTTTLLRQLDTRQRVVL